MCYNSKKFIKLILAIILVIALLFSFTVNSFAAGEIIPVTYTIVSETAAVPGLAAAASAVGVTAAYAAAAILATCVAYGFAYDTLTAITLLTQACADGTVLAPQVLQEICDVYSGQAPSSFWQSQVKPWIVRLKNRVWNKENGAVGIPGNVTLLNNNNTLLFPYPSEWLSHEYGKVMVNGNWEYVFPWNDLTWYPTTVPGIYFTAYNMRDTSQYLCCLIYNTFTNTFLRYTKSIGSSFPLTVDHTLSVEFVPGSASSSYEYYYTYFILDGVRCSPSPVTSFNSTYYGIPQVWGRTVDIANSSNLAHANRVYPNIPVNRQYVPQNINTSWQGLNPETIVYLPTGTVDTVPEDYVPVFDPVPVEFDPDGVTYTIPNLEKVTNPDIVSNPLPNNPVNPSDPENPGDPEDPDVSDYVPNITGFFDNIKDTFNDLVSHFLPDCVAEYVLYGFIALLAVWIIRMAINR